MGGIEVVELWEYFAWIRINCGGVCWDSIELINCVWGVVYNACLSWPSARTLGGGSMVYSCTLPLPCYLACSDHQHHQAKSATMDCIDNQAMQPSPSNHHQAERIPCSPARHVHHQEQPVITGSTINRNHRNQIPHRGKGRILSCPLIPCLANRLIGLAITLRLAWSINQCAVVTPAKPEHQAKSATIVNRKKILHFIQW